MDTAPLSPLRRQLCGRDHADRLALTLCETDGNGYAVVRTGCELQPYRVLPREEMSGEDVEHEVVMVS